jgi:hypothetical protein
MFRLILLLLALPLMAVAAGEKFFSNQDLADRYQVPISTVRYWRAIGTGPQGFRVGGHVRYDPDEVLRWEREQAKAGRERREAS